MKLLRQILGPLLALCFALAPAGAATPGQKAAILNGIQGWSFQGSSADLYFSRNAGSCTINRLLKPCASLLTTTRASTKYAGWADGHYSSFGNNIPAITDQGILIEQASTSTTLWCRDMTNAAWVKVNMTAALTATGIDNAANSASTLTATASNATILQTLTIASSAETYSVFLKRVSGTGTINITEDGGTTWTAVVLTASWARFSVEATLANPVIGIRIVTSGDVIAADFNQTEALTFDTSPIATTTVAVTRAADMIVYPHNPLGTGNFTMFVSVGGVPAQSGKFPTLLSVNGGSGSNETQIYSSNGGNTTNGKEQITVSIFDTTIPVSIVSGAGKVAMTLNGTAARGASNGGNVTALGTWTPTAAFTQMQIGTDNGGANNPLNGYVRRVAIFQAGMTDAQMQAITQ